MECRTVLEDGSEIWAKAVGVGDLETGRIEVGIEANGVRLVADCVPNGDTFAWRVTPAPGFMPEALAETAEGFLTWDRRQALELFPAEGDHTSPGVEVLPLAMMRTAGFDRTLASMSVPFPSEGDFPYGDQVARCPSGDVGCRLGSFHGPLGESQVRVRFDVGGEAVARPVDGKVVWTLEDDDGGKLGEGTFAEVASKAKAMLIAKIIARIDGIRDGIKADLHDVKADLNDVCDRVCDRMDAGFDRMDATLDRMIDRMIDRCDRLDVMHEDLIGRCDVFPGIAGTEVVRYTGHVSLEPAKSHRRKE